MHPSRGKATDRTQPQGPGAWIPHSPATPGLGVPQQGQNNRQHPTPGPRSPDPPQPRDPRARGIVWSHSQPEPAIRSLSLGMAWRARLTTSRRSLLVRNGNSPVEPWITKPTTEPHDCTPPIPTLSGASGCWYCSPQGYFPTRAFCPPFPSLS